jgi:hypothetical protein
MTRTGIPRPYSRTAELSGRCGKSSTAVRHLPSTSSIPFTSFCLPRLSLLTFHCPAPALAFCPILHYPALSYTVLSCPVLPSPILSCTEVPCLCMHYTSLLPSTTLTSPLLSSSPPLHPRLLSSPPLCGRTFIIFKPKNSSYPHRRQL